MKITDAEFELESDPNFITSCKIDGVKVSYAGPKVYGHHHGLFFGNLIVKIATLGTDIVIDHMTEGYYPDDDDSNILNIIHFYRSRVYHGKLYRRDIR